jgi:hypothetical protein
MRTGYPPPVTVKHRSVGSFGLARIVVWTRTDPGTPAPMTHSTHSRTGAGGSDDAPVIDKVADGVEDAVDDRPWLKNLLRAGWVAKGVVYTLMGLTAVTIGRGRPSDDEASPEGAIGQLTEHSGGSVLLVVLTVGLVLYALWRLISAAIVTGTDADAWLHRVGYLFSASFYALLARAAVRALTRGSDVEDPNTIERLSKSALESPFGRWILLTGGLVVLGVGLYFIVKKGLQQSFLDELDIAGCPEGERRLVTTTGTVGWIGRGFVTAAVGVFVVLAAWHADSSEARGFDKTLREVSSDSIGGWVVIAAGIGLIAYGLFCLLSMRHVKLEDS